MKHVTLGPIGNDGKGLLYRNMFYYAVKGRKPIKRLRRESEIFCEIHRLMLLVLSLLLLVVVAVE